MPSTSAHRSMTHSKQFVPRSFQKTTAKFMLSRPAAGCFLDPGLGKTMIVYMVFAILKAKGIVKDMMVVSPLRAAYDVWPAEDEKWGLNQDYVILHGKDKKLIHEPHDMYFTNYESLPWIFDQMNTHNYEVDMIVFDESSKLRNPQAKTRFKLVKRHLHRFKRRYILTGSPTPNGLINLFSQIYCLDGGKALGQFVTHFRQNYFEQDPMSYFPRYIIKPGSDKRIYKAIKPLVIRFGDDQLKMPPKIPIDFPIDLPSDAMKIYKELKKELIVQLKEGMTVRAYNVGVLTHKLRQVANGGIYYGDKKDFKKIHDAKTDAVLELLEGLEGQPALVAYEFHHDLARLQRALPNGTPHIGGGVGPKKSSEIIRAWNRGELPVLLGNPASMAHALNLQESGRAVIWHSLTWDLEFYEQFIRRVWRQGQKRKVFVYHIIARGTVDQAIMQAIGRKYQTQRDLFKALQGHIK